MSTPMPPLPLARGRVNENGFIAPSDWAVLLGASMTKVYADLRDGLIPFVKVGVQYRIPSAWARQQLHLEADR